MSVPPLLPSPEEGRSLLRRELLDPAYQDEDPVLRLVDRLVGLLEEGTATAAASGPLAVASALLLLLVLLLALGWLVSRVGPSARRAAGTGPVLGAQAPGADDLRRRAQAALAEDRAEDALLDAFRAVAARLAERGVLDRPESATAREVAVRLGEEHRGLSGGAAAAADLFEAVAYGGRRASAAHAADVLGLDDALAGAR